MRDSLIVLLCGVAVVIVAPTVDPNPTQTLDLPHEHGSEDGLAEQLVVRQVANAQYTSIKTVVSIITKSTTGASVPEQTPTSKSTSTSTPLVPIPSLKSSTSDYKPPRTSTIRSLAPANTTPQVTSIWEPTTDAYTPPNQIPTSEPPIEAYTPPQVPTPGPTWVTSYTQVERLPSQPTTNNTPTGVVAPQPSGTTTTAKDEDEQSKGGMSLENKIALGVGLGIGVPTLLLTLIMCMKM